MKIPHLALVSRLAMIAMLYPWLVSFDGPGDSLSHTVSIYGSAGSYTHVTRDCNGNILSQLPVPFSEIAASYEVQDKDWSYKFRAGYLRSAYGYNLVVG